MAKKKGSADDFASILGDLSLQNDKPKPRKKTALTPKMIVNKTTGNDTQTTLYYPRTWKRRLKEQALHEDTTVNRLVLEGIKLAFEKRGIKLD